MVVTGGIERAIQYFHAFSDYLGERKSPYQAIVAFSGEHEYGGAKVTEASLNGFPSSDIAEKIQEDPYRFLICADKFQTGYDEPLLHTMYVDKPLSGIKAVQTLSRLNRAHPQKHDCVRARFHERHRDDPVGVFRLLPHDDAQRGDRPEQAARPEGRAGWLPGVFAGASGAVGGSVSWPAQSATSWTRFSMRAWRSTRRGSTRTARWISRARPRHSSALTSFLASVLPYTNRRVGETLDRPQLAHPQTARADRRKICPKGILEAIDMDSYRVEKKAVMKIALADDNAEIGPVPVERRRIQTRAGTGSLEQHPQDVQRTFRDVVHRW